MKIKNIITILAIIFVVVIMIAAALPIIRLFSQPTDPEGMEKELSRYNEQLETIINFCRSLDGYERIDFDNCDFLYDGKEVYTFFPEQEGSFDASKIVEIEIEDKEVLNALYKLFKKGYGIISCNKTGIEFQRIIGIERSEGIAYSFGDSVPEIDFLIYSEPLSKDGWYYYISDFNEYKRQNNPD